MLVGCTKGGPIPIPAPLPIRCYSPSILPVLRRLFIRSAVPVKALGHPTGSVLLLYNQPMAPSPARQASISIQHQAKSTLLVLLWVPIQLSTPHIQTLVPPKLQCLSTFPPILVQLSFHTFQTAFAKPRLGQHGAIPPTFSLQVGSLSALPMQLSILSLA